jgi:hypothetical protein
MVMLGWWLGEAADGGCETEAVIAGSVVASCSLGARFRNSSCLALGMHLGCRLADTLDCGIAPDAVKLLRAERVLLDPGLDLPLAVEDVELAFGRVDGTLWEEVRPGRGVETERLEESAGRGFFLQIPLNCWSQFQPRSYAPSRSYTLRSCGRPRSCVRCGD